MPIPRTPSAPSLTSRAVTGDMEVYIAARPFCQFAGDLMQRLDDDAKLLMMDVGVCHFMTVVRTAQGDLVQFDFGPVGGDVCIDVQPLVQRASDGTATGGRSRSVGGEIREERLAELPPACMFVGRTAMTLADVRSFNTGQSTLYQLNANDCRHYVNKLVQRATGFHSASVALVRHHFVARRADCITPPARLLQAVQHLTDVDNWRAVQSTARAGCVAFLLALRAPLLAVLGPLATPRLAIPVASASAVVLPMMQRTSKSVAAACVPPQDTLWYKAVTVSAAVRRRVAERVVAGAADVEVLRCKARGVATLSSGAPLLLRPFQYSRAAFASMSAFRLPLPAAPLKAAAVGTGAAAATQAAAKPPPCPQAPPAAAGCSPCTGPRARPGMRRVLSAQRVQDAGKPARRCTSMSTTSLISLQPRLGLHASLSRGVTGMMLASV